VRESTAGSVLIEEFVRNMAVARQYHAWFEWGGHNANKFFGLFGSEFRAMMAQRVKDSEALGVAVKAFLEVGNERNRLVHQDYATFSLEKTLEEIFALYQDACIFVETLPVVLRECDAMNKGNSTGVPNHAPEDTSLRADPQG
jgi:hypothetical protein